MTTRDNLLPILTTGQGNWDSDLDAGLQIIERGYHVTERAGIAINTGQVLWLNSGGFFFPFDPNSTSIGAHALAFTAAASGDSLTALAWGIVRSLGINSLAVPGQPLYVSAATPGLLVGSYSGANRQVGWGLDNYGILFDPDKPTTGGGGGGVTEIRSLSDVDPSGLGNGSILKWSNAASKFTMQVDSAGGGGGLTPGAVPVIVQHVGLHGATMDLTFTNTPTVGNLLVFLLLSGAGNASPGSCELNSEAFGFAGTTPVGGTIALLEPHIYTRRVSSGDGKVFRFANSDGDSPTVYGIELSGVATYQTRVTMTRINSNMTMGAPLASTERGNALAIAVTGSDKDISASTVQGNWTAQNSNGGGTFGGGSLWASTNSPLGINSPDSCRFAINSTTANNYYSFATMIFEPPMT